MKWFFRPRGLWAAPLIVAAGAFVAAFDPLTPDVDRSVDVETAQNIFRFGAEFPKNDFKKKSVDLKEIMSGGPPRDGIPSIDKPEFTAIGNLSATDLSPTEPVIGVTIDGKAKAYPACPDLA